VSWVRHVVVLVALLVSVVAMADTTPRKAALVIGNADYPGKARLANTVSDAVLMADTFRALGYETTLLKNTDRATMMRAVAQLADGMKEGGVAALYFAGHGLQLAGENYLLPMNLPPLTQKLVRDDAYPLQHAIDRLRNSGAQVSMIIVDACRNVPYGWGYRALEEEGLTALQPAKGMLIAYATAPGQLALDGRFGSHSPFTSALAESMRQPGMRVDDVFKRVRSLVRERTRDEQQPWIATSLVGDFYFMPPGSVPIKLATALPPPQRPSGRTRQLPDAGSGNVHAPKAAKLEWFQLMQPDALTLTYKDMEINARQITLDDIPRLTRKAEAGNVIAQTTLGLAYRNGPIHWRSNPKAVHWFQAAADQGFAIAENELGEMYYLGRGVDKDVATSIPLFEKAAAAGYTVAKLNLLQAKAGNDPMKWIELIKFAR
jgi:hypothetical protein